MILRLLCPHCAQPAIIRTSRQLSTLVRESYCQCPNMECGHTFVINSAAVRTINPSAAPRADIYLPIGKQASTAAPATSSEVPPPCD